MTRDQLLLLLDRYEGVHEGLYERREVDVLVGLTRQVAQVYVGIEPEQRGGVQHAVLAGVDVAHDVVVGQHGDDLVGRGGDLFRAGRGLGAVADGRGDGSGVDVENGHVMALKIQI